MVRSTKAYDSPYPFKGGKLPRKAPPSVRKARRNGPVRVYRPQEAERILEGL